MQQLEIVAAIAAGQPCATSGDQAASARARCTCKLLHPAGILPDLAGRWAAYDAMTAR